MEWVLRYYDASSTEIASQHLVARAERLAQLTAESAKRLISSKKNLSVKLEGSGSLESRTVEINVEADDDTNIKALVRGPDFPPSQVHRE